MARHVQKRLSTSNFSSKWEGPYVVKEAYNSGYILTSETDSEELIPLLDQVVLSSKMKKKK